MEKQKVIIDKEKCIGCGMCERACVANNIKIENNKAMTYFEKCILCGHCFAICPSNAIQIIGMQNDYMHKEEDVKLDAKKVLDNIAQRRSIRHFKKQTIPEEVITQILEAGRLTHTAKNMQDVSFIVLDKQKEHFEKMAVSLFRKLKPIANRFSKMNKHNEIKDNFFFFNAPLVIVILAENKTNGILAAQNMEFVAEANGLGVLYSGFFSVAANVSRKIRKQLQVPKHKKVAMTLVLGYPAITYLRSAPRKKLDVTYL